jgi:threonylcarbamoyladenosine tRNA methylthiotransferase MtaB
MGRRYDAAGYAAIVERARAAIPGLAVHADVMAGFPGEDEAAHERSVAFIHALGLAGLHVFRYSERPLTAAVRMRGAVDPRIRRRRAADLLALATEARATFAQRAVGSERRVLFEERADDGAWVGRSEDYVEVAVETDREIANVVGRVMVTGIDSALPDRARGRILETA